MSETSENTDLYYLESDEAFQNYVDTKGIEQTYNFNYLFDTKNLCPIIKSYGQNFHVTNNGKQILKKQSEGIMTIHVPMIVMTSGVYEVVFFIDHYELEELEIGIITPKASIFQCWLKGSPAQAVYIECRKSGVTIKVLVNLVEDEVTFKQDENIVKQEKLTHFKPGEKKQYLLALGVRGVGTKLSILSSAWGPTENALGLLWRQKLYSPKMLSSVTDVEIQCQH